MDNANLSKLIVRSNSTVYALEPAFNESVTKYKLLIPSNISSIEIEAQTSDKCASYRVKFSQFKDEICLLNDGLNRIEIEVASEDGTIKVYEISCKKISVNEANLKCIQIKGVALTPMFDIHVLEYFGSVTHKMATVEIQLEKEDPNSQVLILNSETCSSNVDLNYGHTYIEVVVKSPNRANSQSYRILLKRDMQPRMIRFKQQSDAVNHEDPISLQPLYCPISLNGNTDLYSLPFAEFYYTQTKQDFLSGRLDIESATKEWFTKRFDADGAVSKCDAYSPLINGDLSDTKTVREIGGLMEDLNKVDKIQIEKLKEETTDETPEISSIHKYEARSWEKNLAIVYDEVEPKILMEQSDSHLRTYISIRNSHQRGNIYENDKSPLDYLNASINTCATALKFDKSNHELHFKLAILLEEKHYLGEIYGFKDDSEEELRPNSTASLKANTVAKNSSKEEEINAICKLKNVAENAAIEFKIKALDAEYQYLIQNGQREKAEHVEALYHFKVKQSVMNTSMSFRVSDSKMSLGQAFIKYMDALYLTETGQIQKYSYHFHVGRMFCLKSNYQQAVKHFRYCLKWTSDEYKNLVRFYLGYSMSFDPKVLTDSSRKEAVYFLSCGLQDFLMHMSNDQKLPQGVFAKNLYFLPNTAFLQGFINIANIARSFKIEPLTVISPENAYYYCAWLCSQALYEIYLQVDSIKNLNTSSEIIKQLNWLLVRSHSSILDIMCENKTVDRNHLEKRCFYLSALLRNIKKENNLEVLNLQENICQKLVRMSPSNSHFLYLLGNAQLEKYDNQYMFNNEDSVRDLLDAAKSTLLASIELEDKMDNEPVLELVSNQTWWKAAEREKEQVKPVEKPVEVKATVAEVKKVQPPAASLPAKSPKVESKVTRVPVKPTGKAAQPTSKAVPAAKPTVGKTAATKQEPQKKSSLTSTTLSEATGLPCAHTKPKPGATIEVPLVSIEKPDEPAVAPSVQVETVKGRPNRKLPKSRISLARVYSRLKDVDNAKAYYKKTIELEPDIHDAYIEFADMLKKTGNHKEAVDLYETFKFNEKTPTFDDAYVFGEIVNILMKHELYDDPRLGKYMTLWGRVLGIGVLEKYIQKLDEKNKVNVCKEVYCGVNMKSLNDPALQPFFKHKGWI